MYENPNLRIAQGSNPVAVTRAYAKARSGDLDALRWLTEEHRTGNAAASRAIDDLSRHLSSDEDASAA
jgi:hypothetical protein